MKSIDSLLNEVLQFDNQPFYKLQKLKGRECKFKNFILRILRIQGSPGAYPASIFEVEVPYKESGFPLEYLVPECKKIGLEDFITRQFKEGIDKFAKQNRGADGSGSIWTISIGQKILKRNNVIITPERIKVRFIFSFPSKKKNAGILDAQQTVEMLNNEIPNIVNFSLFFANYDERTKDNLDRQIETSAAQEAIRDYLKKHNLIVFIADGSVLPRASGVDDRPLESNSVIPFKAPDSMSVTIETNTSLGKITGMAIKEGVTVITGGGFHGKSTLLSAIAHGVFNHIPGDGREFVITRDDAVLIRAEDGRSIKCVDISPFIKCLPYKKSTTNFSTNNASGSTSQAANMIEFYQAGSRLFLFDEDTCATNFMLRDELAKKIITDEKEPIRPFYNVIRTLWEKYKISSILVIGGLGAFFKKADNIISLYNYKVEDITHKVREKLGTDFDSDEDIVLPRPNNRFIEKENFNPAFIHKIKNKRVNIRIKPLRENWKRIEYGMDKIILDSLVHLVEEPQSLAVGFIILLIKKIMDCESNFELTHLVNKACSFIKEKGLDILEYEYKGLLSMPRKYEIIAAINRMQSLKVNCNKSLK